jgi:DNA polymerase III subunit delta'
MDTADDLMTAPYPWLSPLWSRLLSLRQRLPHAVLLAGPKGVGKLELAQGWAKSLLCEKPAAAGEACGQCEGCHWFEAGTHPDFMRLTLIEKENREGEVKLATEIGVDQAREAVEFIQLSTYRAGRRLVLVEPAEALNTASANALLKVLEEPPISTVFVLVSHQPRQLLPTILSRCHRLEVGLPSLEDSGKWLGSQGLDETALAWAGGAPLTALADREEGQEALRVEVLQGLSQGSGLDAVALAESWYRRLPPRYWQRISYRWLLDLLASHLGGNVRFNPDFSRELTLLGKQVKRPGLLDLAQEEMKAGRWVEHPLNRQQVLEAWLTSYRQAF